MSEIRKFFSLRHLRSEPSVFVLHHRRGRLIRHGKGLAFWFWPLSAAIAQVPMDDREVPFLFKGRSRDHQDVTVQGVVTYRVVNPMSIAGRVDFSINLSTGSYRKQPLESLALLLVQLTQQLAWQYVAAHPLEHILSEGFDALREQIWQGLVTEDTITGMGLELVSVRISAVQPTPELERALQMPAMESMQQRADEATFQRRALAVEKERAIAENELQTRLELARREEQLIEQQGANARRQAQERAEAERIASDAEAQSLRVGSAAEADAIRIVEEARVDAERARMEIYAKMPSNVMAGLAARELASKLQRIDHLNITPDMFGPMLTNLVEAGTRKLTREGE